jgi:hypothetical protein
MTSTVGAAAGVAIHLLLGWSRRLRHGRIAGLWRRQVASLQLPGNRRLQRQSANPGPLGGTRRRKQADQAPALRSARGPARRGAAAVLGNIVWSGWMIPVDDKGDRIKMPAVALDNARSGRSDLFVVGQCTTGIGRSGRCLFPWAPSAAWPPGEASPRIPRQAGNSLCSSGTNAGNWLDCDVTQLAREFTE